MNMPAPTPKRSSPQHLMGAIQSSTGLTLPARSMQSSTTPFVPHYRKDDPTRLHPDQVHMLRNLLRAQMGLVACASLRRFVDVFLADDLVVESYFHTLNVHDRVGQAFEQSGLPLTAVPWMEAKRAAMRAIRAPDLLPKDRPFVYTAAFAMPVGLFNLSLPYMHTLGHRLSDLWQARNATTMLVEDALRTMRRYDAAKGWTMAALMGYCDGEDCDKEQLARMGSALHLSQLRVNELWVPTSGWNQAV